MIIMIIMMIMKIIMIIMITLIMIVIIIMIPFVIIGEHISCGVRGRAHPLPQEGAEI